MRLVVVAMVGLYAAPATAAADARKTEARRYFEAGKKAFVKTKYGAAIAAFEQAHQTSPNPAVIFSLAQAHRLRYFVDHDSADILLAVDLYRRYLAESPTGRRREHAVEHLATIEPLVSRLQLSGTSTRSRRPAPTRLMVQANVEDARVQLDDLAPVAAPLIEEIKPGRHRIKVVAAGYFDKELTRTAAEGAIAVIDVELEPRPATVELQAPSGATIYIDGDRRGQAPLDGPLTLREGRHRLEVIASGRNVYARELAAERGGSMTVTAELEPTTQRVAALWLFAGSAALVAGGSVMLGLGLSAGSNADRTARKLLDEEMALTAEEIEIYQRNKRRRGQFRVLAGSMYGVAAAGLILGGLLFFFDEPSLGVTPAILLAPDGARVGLRLRLR